MMDGFENFNNRYDRFENKELEKEFAIWEVNYMKKATIILTGIAVTTGIIGGVVVCHELTKAKEFTWKDIQPSYIVITRDDNLINYHLSSKSVTNTSYEYYDLINDHSINNKSIVKVEDAVPYFVYYDCVKNDYSEDELKKYLNEFKNNDTYTTSNSKVKIKK